ncbi:MAG: metal ABC transporter ATP-binding protein [Anaerolineaceae bacterium]|nr:metal ABC transporter ATP-binding protein [Anaerolineaceae bacterium]
MTELPASLHAAHLNIGYQEEIIVSDVQFDLRAGESLALIGTNGSGKSTLLKTLVGLLPPLSGELTVLGGAPQQTSRRLAYLSQFHSSDFILPMQALDVVRMGRYAEHGLLGKLDSFDEDLIAESLQRMGISALANRPLRELSGGQQQRVYIAQALARRAEVLVLDEPTSGLDAGAREIYEQALRDELARGASVVVATHDIQEALNCTLSLLLARKVIAVGPGREVITPEALLETFGITINLNQQPLGVTVVERDHCCDHPDEHER